MKKYIYDYIADQEPDGNSEWYYAKDVDKEIKRLKETSGCLYAGSGRGDCAHFIGLPGKSIPGQHDGKDDTVDAYGKPNGWCWSCWKSYQIERLRKEKDWLMRQLIIKTERMKGTTEIEVRDGYLRGMQQALKEE